MKKLVALVLLAVLLLGCICACTKNDGQPSTSENPATTQGEQFRFTLENYPKMGGSLACLPLGEAVTATMLNIDRESADKLISFAGSTTDNYQWILDGTFDIVLVYEPSEDAKKMIEESKVGLEMTAIGADGLVFIGNKNNPVSNLTRKDIEGIFKGNITNWSELGGEKVGIVPFQRNKQSGSQTLFDKFFPLGDELIEPPKEQIVGSMIGLLEAIAGYDGSTGALGYTVYYYLTNMEAGTLDSAKIFDFNGVTPSNETIASGEYELSNDFYVVIRADEPADSPARILYNWLCSEQGKELITRENYAAK